jgi:hypothetical protein
VPKFLPKIVPNALPTKLAAEPLVVPRGGKIRAVSVGGVDWIVKFRLGCPMDGFGGNWNANTYPDPGGDNSDIGREYLCFRPGWP